MTAWTVMFTRVLIEVGVVNRSLLQYVWLPIVAAGVAGLIYCLYLFFVQRSVGKDQLEFSNPFDLFSAIKFGGLYALILLVARTAQMYFGSPGVYISSIFSGLADVDAITISLAQLSSSGNLDNTTAAQAIVLAAMSNTVVKGAMVLISGSPGLRKAILPGFLIVLFVGTVLAFVLI